MEYEVDELRRDIKLAELCAGDGTIQPIFVADKLIVEPGKLETKQGKQYAVYSPWLRCKIPVRYIGCTYSYVMFLQLINSP